MEMMWTKRKWPVEEEVPFVSATGERARVGVFD